MWMWERAQLLGIPLMAGSSLPTLWRSPQFLEYPLDVELDEALSLGCEQLPLHLLCLSVSLWVYASPSVPELELMGVSLNFCV